MSFLRFFLSYLLVFRMRNLGSRAKYEIPQLFLSPAVMRGLMSEVKMKEVRIQ